MSRLRPCPPGDAVLAPSGELAVAVAHVEAARPGDAAHEAHRARTLAFAAAHGDALERTGAESHLTASAMVVDPASRRFLLMLTPSSAPILRRRGAWRRTACGWPARTRRSSR